MVLGLGRFGGGAGVTRFLADEGLEVTVLDPAPADVLAGSIESIADLIASARVRAIIGAAPHDAHAPDAVTSADLVIANPALPRPWDHPLLGAARAAGVPVTTEIRLVTERIPRTGTIGVTGSAGKSTTSAMIQALLHRLGRCAHLGGNIGGSLLPALPRIGAGDDIVLELSSAMLHWLGDAADPAHPTGWSPRTALLTNLAPNHLDWHGSMQHYRASKAQIFRSQQAHDRALRGETEAGLDALAERITLGIPGPHNRRNAAMAVRTVAMHLDADESPLGALLSDFRGLPHRLALVLEHDGRRFFDDSKSTVPEATCLAVAAFDDVRRVHLIAGGYDKGIDLAPIGALASRVGRLYTIGTTGRTIAAHASRAGATPVECGSLDRAVEQALAAMRAGDVLLLSPGCASWDQFTDFEARGRAFASAVARLTGAAV